MNLTDGCVVNRMGLMSSVICEFLQRLANSISNRVTLIHQVQYQQPQVVNKVQKGTRLPSKVSNSFKKIHQQSAHFYLNKRQLLCQLQLTLRSVCTFGKISHAMKYIMDHQ